MISSVITIRRANVSDAEDIAAVHDAAWREAYAGIIPGRELEKMLVRRGPRWWHTAISRGSRISVVDFDETICGYVSYGRNRLGEMPYPGEIFELYLMPEFQGIGFGRRLFEAARQDLRQKDLARMMVWALAENTRAVGFYRHMGGQIVQEADENFGNTRCLRLAFAFL